MGKRNELATALDNMTKIGIDLIACGENMTKTAETLREILFDSINGNSETPTDSAQAETKAKAKRKPETVPEPVPEEKPDQAAGTEAKAQDAAPTETASPAPKTYTKEEVRAKLADLSLNGFRAEAKALVRKYADGGNLTDIDPDQYPELMKEAEQYHA